MLRGVLGEFCIVRWGNDNNRLKVALGESAVGGTGRLWFVIYVRCSMLDVRCSMFDVRCSIFDVR